MASRPQRQRCPAPTTGIKGAWIAGENGIITEMIANGAGGKSGARRGRGATAASMNAPAGPGRCEPVVDGSVHAMQVLLSLHRTSNARIAFVTRSDCPASAPSNAQPQKDECRHDQSHRHRLGSGLDGCGRRPAKRERRRSERARD